MCADTNILLVPLGVNCSRDSIYLFIEIIDRRCADTNFLLVLLMITSSNFSNYYFSFTIFILKLNIFTKYPNRFSSRACLAPSIQSTCAHILARRFLIKNYFINFFLNYPYSSLGVWWPVSQWVNAKIAIFSGSYLSIYLKAILLKFGALFKVDYLNYMCIISALYLKWVLSVQRVWPILEFGLRTLCAMIFILICT